MVQSGGEVTLRCPGQELETLKKLMAVNDKSFEDLELPPKAVSCGGI